MDDLSKFDLTELIRIKDIVEWQITIAKDMRRLNELENQLNNLNKEITKKQLLL